MGADRGEAVKSKPSHGLVCKAQELELSAKATGISCRVLSSPGHNQICVLERPVCQAYGRWEGGGAWSQLGLGGRGSQPGKKGRGPEGKE